MQNTSSGVGGSGSHNIGPTGIGGPGSVPASQEGGMGMEGALHTKVRTLDDLKALLIQTLGPEEGTKLFNRFVQAFALMMISQVQHAAERARRAAQETRINAV